MPTQSPAPRPPNHPPPRLPKLDQLGPPLEALVNRHLQLGIVRHHRIIVEEPQAMQQASQDDGELRLAERVHHPTNRGKNAVGRRLETSVEDDTHVLVAWFWLLTIYSALE